MSGTVQQPAIAPVRKSITVKADLDRAFRVFTEGIDTWWPRSHNISKVPMKKSIVEGHAGGRCYTEQVDGSECDWARVLVWEPPRRLVLAWQISPAWQFEPDLAKASEVEVHFTPQGDGTVRVDLEHRFFERHGEGGESIRSAVESSGGWSDLLSLFKTAAETKA